MAPPMRSAAAMCAVMCALLPAALSHTVETEFVTIPKGGWHVFEASTDLDDSVLHDIKFTNKASTQGCELKLLFVQLEVDVTGTTVPPDTSETLIGGLYSSSTYFVGRNAPPETLISANVTAVDCDVDLQAAFNFYKLHATTTLKKGRKFELLGNLTIPMALPLDAGALYVELATLTMVTPCDEEREDDISYQLAAPRGEPGNAVLTQRGQTIITLVQGMLRVLVPGVPVAVGWVNRAGTNLTCSPVVELSLLCRDVDVPESPSPPTLPPATPAPPTEAPPPGHDSVGLPMIILPSIAGAAVIGGIAYVIYRYYVALRPRADFQEIQ